MNKQSYFSLFITLLLCCPWNSVSAQPSATSLQKLTAYVNELKNDPDIKNSLFSIKVVNGTNKKIVVDHQANLRLIPASVQKMVTTGAGFLVLGKEYVFNTRLAYQGRVVGDSCLLGTLYIVGGGDPTLGSTGFPNTAADSVFSFFAHALKRAGIKQIDGSIVANASYLDGESVHPSWEWEDLGSYYGAGTTGLCFCENSFCVHVSTNSLVRDSVRIVHGYPFYSDQTFLNEVTPSHADSTPNLSIFSSPLSQQYLIKGQLPASGKSIKMDGALQNPPLACATQFTNFLRLHGFVVTGLPGSSHQPVDSTVLHEITRWLSPPYKEIAKSTNAYSNNVFADMILKNVAKVRTGKTDYTQSVNTLMDLLKVQQLAVNEVKIADGSGLSRQNLLTADFLCDYLAMISKQSPDFIQSLPVPGEKGTFQNFMSGYSATTRRRVQLKSGSMTGVINYAGYVRNKKNETQYVTIMVNNFNCKTAVVRKKLEKLIYLLTEVE